MPVDCVGGTIWCWGGNLGGHLKMFRFVQPFGQAAWKVARQLGLKCDVQTLLQIAQRCLPLTHGELNRVKISKLFSMLIYLLVLPNSFQICKPAGIWYEVKIHSHPYHNVAASFFSTRMHHSFLLLHLRLSKYESIMRSRQDNANCTFHSYPCVGLQEAAFLWPRGSVLHTMQDAKIIPLD